MPGAGASARPDAGRSSGGGRRSSHRPIEWLVLCHPSDGPALWAGAGLRRRLGGEVDVLTPEVLAFAMAVEHRLGTRSRVRVELADGRVIDDRHLRGVLNRFLSPWNEHWRALGAEDAAYVEAEEGAFHLGWLAALGDLGVPVLNPPTPLGLCGRFRRPGEWAVLAERAGLRAAPHARGVGTFRVPRPEALREVRQVIALGDRVFGDDLPPELGRGCVRLATLAGTPLLGVFLVAGERGWDAPAVVDATPVPDLRLGGAALLDALADALRGGAP